MTRLPLLALALLLQLPTPSVSDPGTSFLQYRRSVSVPGARTGTAPTQACVVLDAATFHHAQTFLKDLRLFASDTSGRQELPYVLALSEAQQVESDPARVLNLGTRGRTIDFDLAMPSRPYADVLLDLAGKDFLATAVVSGVPAPGTGPSILLGRFNLFDLSSQHLSRSTTLHLQESSFPFLHISLTATPAGGSAFVATPQLVHGASVPPSREAQTLFTPALQTSTLEQGQGPDGPETIARFHLPERIPIERVSFVLAPTSHANFSRDVVIATHAADEQPGSGDNLTGTIQRVKLTSGTHEIDQQQLSIPATLGANLQHPAEVEVAVRNGNDPPLALSSVVLEMRQHSLCFPAPAGRQLTLFYGDPQLRAPVYDLARTFIPTAPTAVAQLGPEQPNPAFQPRPDARPYTERHPHLIWFALLIAVCVLALVAFRSSRKHLHNQHR